MCMCGVRAVSVAVDGEVFLRGGKGGLAHTHPVADSNSNSRPPTHTTPTQNAHPSLPHCPVSCSPTQTHPCSPMQPHASFCLPVDVHRVHDWRQVLKHNVHHIVQLHGLL